MSLNSLEGLKGFNLDQAPEITHTRDRDGGVRPLLVVDLTNSTEGKVSRDAAVLGVVYRQKDGDSAEIPPSPTAMYLRALAEKDVRLGSPRRARGSGKGNNGRR